MTKQIRQTTAVAPNSLSTHMRGGKTQRKRRVTGREPVGARPALAAKRGRRAGRSAAGGINKSAFVRSLPGSLSAAEVIEKGKAKGIKLSAAQVYTIRANARRKGPETEGARAPRASGGREVARVGRGRSAQGKEAEFVEAALDLGLARAEALIRALRAKASAGWS